MSDSLAGDVLTCHRESEYRQRPHLCARCGLRWPCDAYRLAVMVRNIEALAHRWETDANEALGHGLIPYVRASIDLALQAAATDILAITREGNKE